MKEIQNEQCLFGSTEINFCGLFLEVFFRSATTGGFRGLMRYLYTGRCPERCDDWASLIELSDRLCLPQLLHDAIPSCINHLNQMMLMSTSEAISELTDTVLSLVDVAKVINTLPGNH